jgi:hypothetical protein
MAIDRREFIHPQKMKIMRLIASLIVRDHARETADEQTHARTGQCKPDAGTEMRDEKPPPQAIGCDFF